MDEQPPHLRAIEARAGRPAMSRVVLALSLSAIVFVFALLLIIYR